MDGEITTDEVKELLETDADVRIVDIRDRPSFERSHIPGSENVPFHELTNRVEEFEGADRIVTVCPHGEASVQAARLIGSYEGIEDARVESMAGGLEKYGMKFGLVREEREEESADVESPF
ncbi:rhodanese-like domain-containing protein [Natronobacterium texcoconense]|uniref:Rhodanese-related sulfurtransferase n=1 Tax=Natronobacterium texcoconense TaxID=1095778 RepID=A0A1H1IQM5_NATTX|nr:rhodanese-like domain-containing protein [Natronobacterium texcoconense]SDR39608.1 Rhodanese-related sulfurtransferase [Natronobacterium texcoconense]